MKKTLVIMVLALAASATSAFAGTPINESELPKTAREFIAKHFSGDNVRKAEKDHGRRGMEYEVDLGSGAEIDFLENGDWKEVKAARGAAVPTAIIPSAIAEYVSANFEGLSVVEISRKRGGYEVELSNGSELRLTEDAKPMPARNGNGGGRNRH